MKECYIHLLCSTLGPWSSTAQDMSRAWPWCVCLSHFPLFFHPVWRYRIGNTEEDYRTTRPTQTKVPVFKRSILTLVTTMWYFNGDSTVYIKLGKQINNDFYWYVTLILILAIKFYSGEYLVIYLYILSDWIIFSPDDLCSTWPRWCWETSGTIVASCLYFPLKMF